MRFIFSALCCCLFVVSSVGCGPTIPQLRQKAAVDLNCPEFELEVETGKEGKMWVSGCAREGAYKKHCEKGEDGKTCSWVRVENPEPEY